MTLQQMKDDKLTKAKVLFHKQHGMSMPAKQFTDCLSIYKEQIKNSRIDWSELEHDWLKWYAARLIAGDY